MRTWMPNLEWEWRLPTKTAESVDTGLDEPLTSFPGLTGLTRHALAKAEIETLGALLIAYREKMIATVSGIGAARLNEIVSAIKNYEANRKPPKLVPAVTIAWVLVQLHDAATAVSRACPDGFVGGQARQVDRPDGIRVVMRWRVPKSPRLVAGKLRAGIPGVQPDPRFHYLASTYVNAGFQGDTGQRK